MERVGAWLVGGWLGAEEVTAQGSVAWTAHLGLCVFCVLSPGICCPWLIND